MKTKSSGSKLLGLCLILGSTGLLYEYFANDILALLQPTPKIQIVKTHNKKSALQKLWEEDIRKMIDEKVFNNGIASIRKVRVFMLDKNLHSQFEQLKAPFKYNKHGQNLLEVSFMSHYSDADKSEKLIVQYNLTDKDSGNMFWEHSRTITIPDSMIAN